MHWARSATLILLALSGIACVGLRQQTADFVIRLPQEVQPEWVTIETFGTRLAFGELDTKKGVYDYPVDVKSAESLKLLIYYPGYKLVAAEFSKDALKTRQTFVPPLEKLPTTPLEVRLVNSKQQPLSDQTLHLWYDLVEAMPFFGYVDGPVPHLLIATVKTNERGAVTLEVPTFAEDPFFEKYKTVALEVVFPPEDPSFQSCNEGQFSVSSKSEFRSWRDDTLCPGSFPTEKSYNEPLIITKTEHGTLSGQLDTALLQRHGLTGDLTPYINSVNNVPFGISLHATAGNGQVNYNAKLKSDRTFEVNLAPGKYDLILMVLGPGGTLAGRDRPAPRRSQPVVPVGCSCVGPAPAS